jgi:accessory gene regulator protein AgrB
MLYHALQYYYALITLKKKIVCNNLTLTTSVYVEYTQTTMPVNNVLLIVTMVRTATYSTRTFPSKVRIVNIR